MAKHRTPNVRKGRTRPTRGQHAGGSRNCRFALRQLERGDLVTFADRHLDEAGLPNYCTRGAGKLVLVAAIRAYRLLPRRDILFRHPQAGSSHLGLAAALRGEGTLGVARAIRQCGCMP